MATLKQTPVREVTRYRNQDSHIHRDVVAPFGVQRRDYLACCRFSNSIEQHGIKPSAISVLSNGDKGFRLSMRCHESGSEYEVEVRDGMAKLGLIREHQPRLLLAQGSASAETTWTRFTEVIKEKESSK